MNLRKLSVVLALILAPLAAQAAFKPDAPTVLITGANRGIGLELARQYGGERLESSSRPRVVPRMTRATRS